MRVIKMDAKLHLGVEAGKLDHLDRVLEQFEDFCTVTQSVGQGIPIHTRVLDSKGVILKDWAYLMRVSSPVSVILLRNRRTKNTAIPNMKTIPIKLIKP